MIADGMIYDLLSTMYEARMEKQASSAAILILQLL
jgi:hypothetical protein